MLGYDQRPVLLLEDPTKEMTYILNATPGQSPHAHISFFSLSRKITDHLTTRTTEEEVIGNIPHMVSVREILEPILAQYPHAHWLCYFSLHLVFDLGRSICHHLAADKHAEEVVIVRQLPRV